MWRMRQSTSPARSTWGTYISKAIDAAGISKAELARRVGTDAGTVFRWLSGKHVPERADVVARVADVLGLDLEEALAAAGMRPDAQPPAEPTAQTPPRDPEIAELERRMNDPEISEQEKAAYRALLRYAVEMRGGVTATAAATEEPDRATGHGKAS